MFCVLYEVAGAYRLTVDTKIRGATKLVYMYGGKKPCDEKAMKAGGHELKGTAWRLAAACIEIDWDCVVYSDRTGGLLPQRRGRASLSPHGDHWYPPPYHPIGHANNCDMLTRLRGVQTLGATD